MRMSKRVLLTGGGGAIGCHVVAHLMHNTDWDLVVLDSFRHKGNRDRIREVLSEHPDWTRRVTVLQHDLVAGISPELHNRISDPMWGNGPDYILHLAAMSDVFFSVENPSYVIYNNVMSTLMMLEYARTLGAGHEAFVMFSTDEVYGPVASPEHGHDEWDPMRPSNAYSASKAASEAIAYPYWRKGDVRLILTNTMNNFGEMQEASKFPAMVQRAVARGESVTIHGRADLIGTRHYLHSRNTADALLFILRELPPRVHQLGELDDPDRYHIVGERAVDNLELAQLIARLMGKPLEFEFVDFHAHNPAHDIHYGLTDNKLAKAGWRPPLGLEESLANTIEWQKAHPEWM